MLNPDPDLYRMSMWCVTDDFRAKRIISQPDNGMAFNEKQGVIGCFA